MALIVLRFHWGWIEIWTVDFWGGSKTEGPGEKPLEQGREPKTYLTRMWCQVRESNRNGWRELSSLHPCSLNIHAGNGGLTGNLCIECMWDISVLLVLAAELFLWSLSDESHYVDWNETGWHFSRKKTLKLPYIMANMAKRNSQFTDDGTFR